MLLLSLEVVDDDGELYDDDDDGELYEDGEQFEDGRTLSGDKGARIFITTEQAAPPSLGHWVLLDIWCHGFH